MGGLLVVIATTAFAQVFSRYVLRDALIWTYELDILLMIWAVWLGAAIGIQRKAHLRTTLISQQLSAAKQRALAVFLDVSILCLLFMLIIEGIEVIQSFEGMALASIPIPKGVVVAAAPVGSVLMVLFFLPSLIGDLKELSFVLKAKRRVD